MDVTERAKAAGNNVASPAGSAEAQIAQETSPISLSKLHAKGQVIELKHEGSEDNLQLKSATEGIDEEARGKAEGRKKRSWCANGKTRNEMKRNNRSKNCADEETKVLLKVFPQKMNVESRSD